MNDDTMSNLVPQSERTKEKQREIARQGGIASGEARRRKRDLRLALESLLERDYTDKKGETLTGAEAIAARQMKKALDGNTRAFEVIRDTVGQKPVERIVVAEVSQNIIDEVEAAVLDDPSTSD